MNLRTEIQQSIESLQPILGSWRELAQQQPYRRPEWLLAWWQSSSRNGQVLYVVVARDEESRIRGISPCYMDLESRTVRFLGEGETGVGDLGLVVDDRLQDESVPAAIAAAFVEHSKAKDGWLTLQLNSIDGCDRNMNRLLKAMQSHGMRLHACNGRCSHLVDPLDDWDFYFEAQTKTTREMIVEARKRLDNLRVRWVSDRIELDEFFPVLRELHQKQAMATGHDSPFSVSGFESMVREWALGHLENNRLQAFSLWQGQRPVACEFGIRSKDRWFCHLSATEPELDELVPTVLSNLVILRAAERFGVRSIQFLNGNKPSPFLRGSPTCLSDWTLSTPNWRGYWRHWMSLCKAQTNMLYGKIIKQA